ncbi:DUF6444 domain-containing protein, partial [Paenibacillus marchantiophytorum]|uniref:DUF6444 domain-containing protein n=1 Tax=Paenibacillus marchantiophytorum TaxID=1619310 RepID=UPI0016640641
MENRDLFHIRDVSQLKCTEEQVLQISKGDPEIAAFITSLLTHIEQLNQRIQELERQLGQNSQNSSKPPSSDGFRKPPKNSRQSGGKKGAPLGHKGHTLRMTDQPDHVVIQQLVACPCCYFSLCDVPSTSYERRQVFDLPPQRLEVTEYRTEQKRCPHCLTQSRSEFPATVTAPVQYGERFGAWAVYLTQYQLLPLDRVCKFFFDLLGQRPSEGTLLRLIRFCG